MNIKLFSTHAEVKIEEISGQVRTKAVSLSQLAEVLAPYRVTESKLLPPGTRYIKMSSDTTRIIIQFPAKIRNLRYEFHGKPNEYYDDDDDNVDPDILIPRPFPCPAGVMIFELKSTKGGGYKIVQSQLYALPSDDLRDLNTTAFRYPLPNVYQDGRLCWGQKNLPDLPHLSMLEGIIEMFFASTFNRDLLSYDVIPAWGKKKASEVESPVDTYFTLAAEKTKFDSKDLVSYVPLLQTLGEQP